MRHGDGARVQMQAAREAGQERRLAAVFGVAQDRVADQRAMGAELVRAPGHRPQRQPRGAVAGAIERGVIGDRAARVLVVLARLHHALAVRAQALGQGRVDAALPDLRPADHDRPIDLARLLAAERLGQFRRRPGASPQYQNARSIAVEAMHQARAFLVPEAQRIEHAVEMMRRAGAALHRQARRLVDHQDRFILVQHRGAQFLGIALGHRARRGRPGRRGAQWRHAHGLAFRQAQIGLGALAVDPDLAGAQQLLQMAVRDLREMAAEPAVEPKLGLVRGDGAGFNAGHGNLRPGSGEINAARRRRRGSRSPPTPGYTPPPGSTRRARSACRRRARRRKTW
jgi:hypothetical protein